VELLVVIAIIGILVALLLPAIQAAREAARRTQCNNNLKQLALGVHNYNDTHKVLPPGTVKYYSGVPGVNRGRSHWSWGAMILPNIEQQALYDGLGVSERSIQVATNNANWPNTRDLMQTPLAAFRCPSDTGPDLNNANNDRKIRSGSNNNRTVALSNYVASLHSDDDVKKNGDGVFLVATDESDMGSVVTPAITFADILDGTSNTIALGERAFRVRRSNGNLHTCWAGIVFGSRSDAGNHSNNGASTNSGPTTVLAVLATKINNAETSFNGDGCRRAYSSQHPGGALFALCDGSVRFISQDINFIANDSYGTNPSNANYQFRSLLPRLVCRDDGETISEY